jgi:predicted ATPase/DNA-binding SARP family transcriptional activator/Flp pilus assembly protein TadD
MQVIWRIRLLGGLRVENGETTITRFRSQKNAALLAYLALFRHRNHSREELADLLWPDADVESGRTNLRTALASLRRQLEPPGIAMGSVLVTHGRQYVTLNLDAISLDVADFDTAMRGAERTRDAADRVRNLEQAVALYDGPLLPGFYETWALTERDRIAESYRTALTELAGHYEQAGDAARALDYARRAVATDTLNEAGHAQVIRLLMTTGQTAAAQRQFKELERLLREQLDVAPSNEVRALLAGEPGKAPLRPVSAPAAAVPTPKLGETSHVEESALASSLVTEAAPSAVPPAPPTPVLRLPLTLTRFFGRDDEIVRLVDLLSPAAHGVRLVTLTGPGGAGKTRLSIEVSRRLAGQFPGGIRFIALAELRDATQIPAKMADALDLPRSPASQPIEQIVEALADGPPVLFALDNVEQFAEAGSDIIAELLARIPSLSLLITSRQKLQLDGEREFTLLPLPLPAPNGSPERLLEFPSIQLFVDRAQSARPDFQITERNADAVAALCARLEGIPLALELCATWSQTLTPAQMLQRMERRFDLLVNRRRDSSPRHATLRATIEWSYELLPPETQKFLRSLFVFHGSWNLPAAEAICEEPDALHLLTELRDRSLVLTEEIGTEGNEEIRFRMLDSLRAFTAEQVTPEEQQALKARHARYYLQYVDSDFANHDGPHQADWFARWDAEHENFVAALRWFETAGTASATRDGLLLAVRIQLYWSVRGYVEQGERILSALLARSDTAEQTALRARALLATAGMARILGKPIRAQALLEESLVAFRAVGDPQGEADVLCNLGLSRIGVNDYQTAHRFFEESLQIYRAIGDRGGAAHALKCLGACLLDQGDFAGARGYMQESMALYRHNPVGRNMMVGEMGRLALVEGDVERAATLFLEHLTLSRELKAHSHVASALHHLGRLEMQRGDLPHARAYLEEGVALRKTLGETQGAAYILVDLARVALEAGDYADARGFAETVLMWRDRLSDPRILWGTVEALAQATIRAGNTDRELVRLLAAVQAGWAGLGIFADEQGIPEHRDAAPLQEALGGAMFQACWEEGKAWTLAQTVQRAISLPPFFSRANGGAFGFSAPVLNPASVAA